jgi:hypothetical protein
LAANASLEIQIGFLDRGPFGTATGSSVTARAVGEWNGDLTKGSAADAAAVDLEVVFVNMCK